MKLSLYFSFGSKIFEAFHKGHGYIPEKYFCTYLKNGHIYSSFSGQKRKYFSALYDNIKEKQNLIKEMDQLYDNILTSNWNDSVNLVLNVSIWEGILSSMEEKIKAYEYDKEITKKKKEINELFDVLFILEDLRDHINEILEQSSRCSGLAGTHILASFKIENMNEHLDFLKKKYEQLLVSYPLYKYQINLVLGQGLALLRQRYTFEWKHMHDFFF
ncbi:hypothetical protein MKS88_004123 [Plasmodium brasilianum]|uniref:DUF6827 domain-containing protein n=2 Tax=Plasmodium (Plasmodium) TaxID=418103 RepID=A0A1A8W4M2_PLAMA|nr:conserved Plasmodium protein, unknown function [Plasmodium malariae]KAI4836331.1 hypothetical protein MKS88_004123 [Plasmodium brasilianum]SBS87727.1 conserved Plasmodium protein, unknown function [Plasmodium malariae]SCO93595.1 conserved Plasmodium protein, unknown function [Plasmodium malariae]